MPLASTFSYYVLFMETYMSDMAVCHENSFVNVFDAEEALELQYTR